jgi:glycyl-tRNA synthetase beta chain
VRPLQRILCTFDGEVVPFEIAGIASDNLTEGHRFMGDDPAPFAVSTFEDYAERLADRYVMLDPAERRARIAAGCRAACEAEGLEWIEDAGLLDEVAGLVEWPVPILGRMDAAFLDLPPEVIATSMRVHQRYFAVRDPATGRLAPRFVVVANIEPKDGGAVIAHGNARVLTARLADARFFWTQDQQPSPDGTANFDRWLAKLNGVTFHAKLGTMAARVERIAALAAEIAPLVGADPKLARLAARLAKADLASGMVGEFPELQGIMGGYYVRAAAPARASGRISREDAIALAAVQDGSEDPLATVEQIVAPTEPAGDADGSVAVQLAALTLAEREAVADAVRDHYKPQGPSDSVPTAPLTVAVALADKLDTLVGFFAIDERPTGSKDPFALRRAALGVVRVILGENHRLGLKSAFGAALLLHMMRVLAWIPSIKIVTTLKDISPKLGEINQGLAHLGPFESLLARAAEHDPEVVYWSILDEFEPITALLAFFADRLKVLLRDEGKRHDLVDAVFALGDDDLVRIVARVEALSAFLATEDGASLLAGYRRAANILKAEAKKAPGEDYALNWDLALLAEPQERALSAALRTVQGEVGRDLDREDFEAAMRHLSHLRAPVDAFFDAVLVNAPDPAVRLNRLRLLAGVRDTANLVADFSLVASA